MFKSLFGGVDADVTLSSVYGLDRPDRKAERERERKVDKAKKQLGDRYLLAKTVGRK